jgi:hypothetical protein
MHAATLSTTAPSSSTRGLLFIAPDRRRVWEIADALAWYLSRRPSLSLRAARAAIEEVFWSGKVPVAAIPQNANPEWAEARKAEFARHATAVAPMGFVLRPSELTESVLKVEIHPSGCVTGAWLLWASSRVVGFIAPEFDRDLFINIALELEQVAAPDGSTNAGADAAPPAPETDRWAKIETLYQQRIDEHGIIDKPGRPPWLPLADPKTHSLSTLQGDEEWAKANGISRAEIRELREAKRTGRRGRPPLKLE